ncbi:MAG: hypothetical protein AAGN46_17115 [Acidobacteriota bacterium]
MAFRLDGTSWPDLLERFDTLNRRAALVGPKGRGKTTLLEELERHFAGRGWLVCRVRLNAQRRRTTAEERRAIEEAGEHVFVTIDGTEQLSWLSWRRLRRASRRAGALLVTTHRPGPLPSLYEHRTSPELLCDLVGELVGTEQQPREDELVRLFEAHGGNIRQCLRELYDRWSDQPAARGSDLS